MTKEDANLEKRRNTRLKKLARKEKGELTIAERLTLRGLERTVAVPFEDRHGKFAVKMHVPLRYEYDEIVRLQEELKSGVSERMEKAGVVFFKIITSLCVDDSLNYEFWQNGDYDAMDMIRLIEGMTSEMTEKVQEAQSFRTK